jgi:hypothetical protein
MNLNPFKSPEYSNPADAAQPYLDQVPDTLKPYYDPYINAGQNALSTLMGQYQTLLNDPNKIMNQIGSGYQQSPGYQFQYNQGMNAINNAAAAGGQLGNNAHQLQAGGMATNLANQDFYNYLSQALGLYGKGLSGTEGINQMGYGASNELAQSLANNMTNQGNLAYAGQQNQNQANSDAYSARMGLYGSIPGAATGIYKTFW